VGRSPCPAELVNHRCTFGVRGAEKWGQQPVVTKSSAVVINLMEYRRDALRVMPCDRSHWPGIPVAYMPCTVCRSGLLISDGTAYCRLSTPAMFDTENPVMAKAIGLLL
jgi:hypothetical protein